MNHDLLGDLPRRHWRFDHKFHTDLLDLFQSHAIWFLLIFPLNVTICPYLNSYQWVKSFDLTILGRLCLWWIIHLSFHQGICLNAYQVQASSDVQKHVQFRQFVRLRDLSILMRTRIRPHIRAPGAVKISFWVLKSNLNAIEFYQKRSHHLRDDLVTMSKMMK